MDAKDIANIEAAQPAYQDETDPTVRDGWQVENLGSLEWAMSRIADLEAERDEVQAATLDAVHRVEARGAALVQKVERGVHFFRGQVLRYIEAHRGELLKGGARKSRTLIYGTVGWRSGGGRLKAIDKDALAAWAAAQPVELGLYRVKVEPDMKAIQAYAKRTGEVPPGTEYETEHETAYVTAVQPGTTLTKGAHHAEE